MSAEHLKSQTITDATATPIVLTTAHRAGGNVKAAGGTITPTAAAEANSTYRFCRVPSNARILRVLWTSADFTTAGAVNVGVYAKDGGAVVDADLFAAALALQSGPYAHSDITFSSGEYTVAEADKMLWEVLGLSADPQTEYDITATVSTQFDGGKAMRLDVEYVR